MFLINMEAIPTKSSDQYGEVLGAFVSLYIDYKDIDGAFKLAKYYIEEEGWKITDLENDFSLVTDKDALDEEQMVLYKEALEYGYAIIFNCYEEE